ncbi:glutamate racemase [Hufsiella ginkgonis]|uniref:Glutamate racemase n=1 Tax=Hufsiella ginkgonis TaxID=2695274 RepID=A0A7K1XXE2_9SPHI|nr:glutamate racemase [Hufsiella ginkgonis]MXV15399.1 glutamate racemase [Hufsiella ginkgonis]
MAEHTGPIGIFDSGYGGLTVFKEIAARLPQYDYIYLGDNARVPYGNRSFETVYQYTLECVNHLFDKGCHLVILACNTASAKALRTIQQQDLPKKEELRRVLGVIRPTTELVGELSLTKHVGVLATTGTVSSLSYPVEIGKFYPDLSVFQQACPMWVPLVENNEHQSPGADYFIKQGLDNLLEQSPDIDVIILGCTHYPLLINKIREYVPENTRILSQGAIVAERLEDYLLRHPEMAARCSKNGSQSFFTTESATDFDRHAAIFFGKEVRSVHLPL